MPSVAPDFMPYGSNGHWVYTDQGWTWDSDYPWGWATFHYGRWFFEDGYGWMWIPGNEWAPAWVSWRQSPDYYGWAPLGPQVTMSASFNGGYNPPPHYWCFVPQRYVASPQVNNYFVSQQQNVTIIHNTTIIQNTTVNNTTIINNNVNNRVTVNNYAGGPDPAQVSRVSGTVIRPIQLRESSRPGENSGAGMLSIYRPRINTASAPGGGASAAAPAPPHVQSLNQVHPINSARYNSVRPVSNPSASTSNPIPTTPAPIGGNPSNTGNPNNTGYPRNSGNPNSTPTNTTPINTTPVNSTPSGNRPTSTAPASNAPSGNHPAYTRPGTGNAGNNYTGNNSAGNNNRGNSNPSTNNATPVRTQQGTVRPQPGAARTPGTNNQPATVKKPAPVPRPLNQAPAADRLKSDKDNKDKPNN
jgi:hypothetical protein